MNDLKKITAVLFCVIFTLYFLPLPVYANGLDPPSLTLIIKNAPSDLKVEIDGHEQSAKKSIGGRFVRFRESSKHECTFISSEGSKHVVLPDEAFHSYDKYAVIDYRTLEVSIGQPFWRTPAIIAARVLCTLIIEGILLFVFGFSGKRNIIVFLITNIVTQTFLNLTILTDNFGSWEMLLVFFDEIVIFIVEAIVYCIFLRNKKENVNNKLFAVLFALTANFASFITGWFVIFSLPF